MAPEDRQELKQAIKEGIREALKQEVAQFYVERETHFKHHQFIESFIKWTDTVKSNLCRTIIWVGTTGVLSLLAWGFVSWIKKHTGGP